MGDSVAIREVVRLYNQEVTDFDLRIWIRPEVETDGSVVVTLAEEFMATLVLPGCQVTTLWTKRPDEDAKLNTGDFSDRRWTAAVKKLRSGEYHVLDLEARNPHWPPQSWSRYPLRAI